MGKKNKRKFSSVINYDEIRYSCSSSRNLKRRPAATLTLIDTDALHQSRDLEREIKKKNTVTRAKVHRKGNIQLWKSSFV